ncbi:Ubiquitin-protein ligase E3 [Schizosaccharomyces pombe]|uniref:Uncharacterized RING finger protein C32F12.07c n=1 Tax=Schizosaccharomyces pombe (strain 972 / ATCC 24843) TaxID=284812 RepID=YG87_SCHPO|nr:putative MARCH family ubiquitin-protein ligase E3 [Schizosaccharomyces pombe]O74371.1 RecName: Full=Uncharacterized RING finger protein C32F12.07c [Schizosaccharomyces pombe 972h-]CAA19368.1 ubiquitin-protein ligase E3, MARCH family (predicted) [Schizosaccharomyces pombe]|eukprot:NP_596150.1 putative MARCH family ubiquitin-protein ligase E3 [Schizosaccharomyces pombe]
MTDTAKYEKSSARCWICYEEYDKKLCSLSNDSWRRPCRCSLIAHESCLISYITRSGSTRCPQCLTAYRIAKPPKEKSWAVNVLGIGHSLEAGLAQVTFGVGSCLGITKFIYSIFKQTGIWICKQVADESSLIEMLKKPVFSSVVLPLLPCMLVRFYEAPPYDIAFSLYTHFSIYSCAEKISNTSLLLCTLPWVRSLYKELMTRIFDGIVIGADGEFEDSETDWFRQFEAQVEHRNQVEDVNEREDTESEFWILLSVAHVFLDAFTTKILRIVRPILLFPLAGKFLGRFIPGNFTKLEKSIIGAFAALVFKDIFVYGFIAWRKRKPWSIRILDNPRRVSDS